MSSEGVFRSRTFSIDAHQDTREFEKIKQDEVDREGEYKILEEERHWDKEGGLTVYLEYLDFT